MKGNILISMGLVAVFFIAGCASAIVKAPPGQIQKSTGYNPASGKYHPPK